MKVLVVVDMQNDFIDGALGTKEAQAIVPNVMERIIMAIGASEHVFYTRDTHGENYLETQEGTNLPIAHCIKDTYGWEIHPDIEVLRFAVEESRTHTFDKNTFGSVKLAETLKDLDTSLISNSGKGLESITFIGLCTDICVISNAMLTKAYLPDVTIIVDSKCCAGVTPESHKTALAAMAACQIQIK